jgi:NMD protein affecting ribosome stability and mRNA decay
VRKLIKVLEKNQLTHCHHLAVEEVSVEISQMACQNCKKIPEQFLGAERVK